MLSGDVEMVGEISDAEKPAFLSGAVGLLMPLDWPEPFGLVMIEAMACGTPVIAFNRGAVPEIIEEGLTGFIVENEDEAVVAVSRLGGLSRTLVRSRFDQRFTARRMATEYLDVYAGMVSSQVAIEFRTALSRPSVMFPAGLGLPGGDLRMANATWRPIVGPGAGRERMESLRESSPAKTHPGSP